MLNEGNYVWYRVGMIEYKREDVKILVYAVR